MLLLQKKYWFHKQQQGYGLLQLVFVLAMILIICSLSLPRLNFLSQRLLRLETEKIVLMFRYLQRIALASNQDHYFYFSLQEGWYEGAGQREYLPGGACFGVADNVYGPPAHPTHVVTEPSTYKENKITFYAHGTVQPGTLYIVDSQKQGMYAVSCSVSPLMQIRAYRYDMVHKKWILL